MRRTYIPVHFDKTIYRTLYYDSKERRFFESSGGQQNSLLSLLSGTVGVVLYSYLSNWTLSFTDSRLTMMLVAAVLTLLLTISLIWLCWYISEKSRHKWEYVPTPSPEELQSLVRNGRRWLMSQVMLLTGFFMLNVFFTLFLFLFFNNGIVFVGMIILWAILFLMLWLLQPFARLRLLRRLEKQRS
ncbi:MFS family permease [Sporosarcina luteola]|nr:MFS family permease [Sporosarcina luteola]